MWRFSSVSLLSVLFGRGAKSYLCVFSSATKSMGQISDTMVFFICDKCGDSQKKNQVDTHKFQCRSHSFSCMDCSVVFTVSTVKKTRRSDRAKKLRYLTQKIGTGMMRQDKTLRIDLYTAMFWLTLVFYSIS